MIVGALDLATKTGVCWGEPGQTPKFESWLLGSMPYAGRPLSLMRRIQNLFEQVKPEAVIIEAPLRPHSAENAGTNFETALALNGMVYVAIGVCHDCGVDFKLIERQAALKSFTGRGAYPEKKFGRNGGKKACMARCELLRWPAEDFDQADAAALWWHGITILNTKAAIEMQSAAPARVR